MKRNIIASLLIVTAFTGGSLHAAASTPSTLPASLTEVVREPSTWVDARVLAANTAETVTAPSSAQFSGTTNRLLVAVFSSTCASYYVAVTGTAAVPAADITNGTASERNPAALKFDPADTFSIITPDTCTVTVAWYLARG